MKKLEVKICGLTRREDALKALACGADYLGFVLHPASPRYIAPDALRRLVAGLPPETRTVGVFVDRPAAEMLEIMAFCHLKIVQLHGRETVEVAGQLAGYPVWKAVHLGAAEDLAAAAAFPAKRLVADSRRGGSGELCDWTLAAQLARRRPVMLAGGLTPVNIRSAAAAVQPAGVDLAGGVEAAPGVKSAYLIEQFFQRLKGIER